MQKIQKNNYKCNSNCKTCAKALFVYQEVEKALYQAVELSITNITQDSCNKVETKKLILHSHACINSFKRIWKLDLN